MVGANDFFTSYTQRNILAKFETFVRRVTDSRLTRGGYRGRGGGGLCVFVVVFWRVDGISQPLSRSVSIHVDTVTV